MKVIKIYTVEQIKDGGALPLFQKFVKADDFLQLQTENKELRDKLKDLYENRFEPDKLHIKLERLKSIGD